MARATEVDAPHTPPGLGDYLRAVWRRKLLIVIGLALGLALGAVVLPKVLTNEASYQATQRLKVAELVSDTIVRERPQFESDRAKVGGGNALQDIRLADRVLDRLGSHAAGLTARDIVSRLSVSPIPGSSYVDLAYTDGDQERAVRVVNVYATAWARSRNAVDARRLKGAMDGLDRQIAGLQKRVGELNATALPTETQKSELSQAQARLGGLAKLRDDILKQQLFLGAPTDVVGTPVVVQMSAPTSPVLILALGLLIGLLAGIGAALLVEATRPKVLAPADVEHATGLPVIASVPGAGLRGGLPVLKRSFSPAAEGYRRVAGALERRGLGDDVRILTIASADAGEGKSLLAANLAHLLARQGYRVLLISADLRRPRLDKLMGVAGEPGLADWLENGGHDIRPWLRTVTRNLLVLPAGGTDRNPGELITMRHLRASLQPIANAGLTILVDTPAALWSAEAMTLAAAADATLLVARVRNSRWWAIEYLAKALRRDGVREIGMVLVGTRRKVSSFTGRYSYGRGYTGRHQAGGRVPEAERLPAPPALDPSGNGAEPERSQSGHLIEFRNGADPWDTSGSSQPAADGLPSPSSRRRKRA